MYEFYAVQIVYIRAIFVGNSNQNSTQPITKGKNGHTTNERNLIEFSNKKKS